MRNSRGLLHRMCAVVCLAVYLGVATSLMPALVALVAWADGDHRVMMASGENGVSIVLRHGEAGSRTGAEHAHCPVSRTLVMLAEPSATADPDHVLNFSVCHPSTLYAASIPTPAGAAQPATTSLPGCPIARPVPARSLGAKPLAVPPPDLPVEVVRTTVLRV
ncbi:MAG: hypothetical protein WCP53_04135 [Verrucomicrobiota bacterium]